MDRPAFYRIGYNEATGELFLAYDIGLTPEKPTAQVRFCRFLFDDRHEFRGALDQYYTDISRGLPVPHSRTGFVDAVRQD